MAWRHRGASGTAVQHGGAGRRCMRLQAQVDGVHAVRVKQAGRTVLKVALQRHAHGAKGQFLPGNLGLGKKAGRSEEHTSELQSQSNLVCRLLLEKKKKMYSMK